jgi:single-stranded-DNA-specific exonuclease
VLITVDNGIASIDGVAHAALGLQVLVTDHHLPASQCQRRTGVLPARPM